MLDEEAKRISGFASARSMWTESVMFQTDLLLGMALPRHVPCGLNQQKCTRRCIQIYGMCRESVDSFSLYVLQYCALTIFPCSSATKAISIAINGSPGRTIDRFSWCEPHRFFCLLNLRVNEHFDIFPY